MIHAGVMVAGQVIDHLIGAERMSVGVIDAFYKSGIYSRYEVNGSNGKYLADGLHPNTDGAKVLGKCYSTELKNSLK